MTSASKTEASRVVAITGGSAGLGLAVAREFAAHGYDVGLIARGEERLRAAESDIRKLGRRALAVRADVADHEAVETAAEQIERRLGCIDVWINNASVTVFSPVHALTAPEYERVTRVTYLGQVYGTLAVLRRMRARNRGVIVHVGSALAYRAIPLQSAYCGAKHAIRAFVDSLRVELQQEGSGVRVTMVQLPSLNTPQFSWSRSRSDRQPQPVPPIFQPEVAARAVYFAATHARREVWLGARAVAVMMLSRLAPKWVDHYLKLSGSDSQFIDAPLPPDFHDNLFEPAPQVFGAHGIYSGRARRHSLQFRLERTPFVRVPANLAIAVLEAAIMLPGFIKKWMQR